MLKKKPTSKRKTRRPAKLPFLTGSARTLASGLSLVALAAGLLLVGTGFARSHFAADDASTTGAGSIPASAHKSVPRSPKYCGHPGTPSKIDTVIVIAEENRTWDQVGLGFSPSSMPLSHMLASQCAYFTADSEVNDQDNSAQQYVGAWTGYNSAVTHVQNSCRPSASCSFAGNNIFQAMRTAAIPHREYVEGAQAACSSSGNVLRHVPEMYMSGEADKAACSTEILPLSRFNFSSPAPGFSFITPTLCNDGHDCANDSVDSWLSSPIRLPALLNSRAYKAGRVIVELWWDESSPRPNLFACWYCHQVASTSDPHYSGESLLWLNLLGAPTRNLGEITTANDIRPIIGAR